MNLRSVPPFTHLAALHFLPTRYRSKRSHRKEENTSLVHQVEIHPSVEEDGIL